MKIKKILLIASIVYALLIVNSYSQSVGIGASAFTPDPSAMFEVNSANKGVLITRVTTANRDLISSPAEGLLIFNTTTKCFEAYVDNSWNTVSCPSNCTSPSAPTAGTIIPSQTQIVWNWNSVSGATGYKWGTTNVYSAATDIGASTTKTQTELSCNASHTLYVWSYNSCGNSTLTTLIQTTSGCCSPGSVTEGGLTKTISCDGNYTVISWTYSSSPGSTTWTVPSGVTSIEYLVVGGGGSGGYTIGAGGGGAGGVKTGNLTELSGLQIVTVGKGGDRQINNNNNGYPGESSRFASVNTTGGGYGAKNLKTTGGSGGSGGGGGAGSDGTQSTGGAGISGEGQNGGKGKGNDADNTYGGGGGGGNSTAGGDGNVYGGNGGNGTSSIITGTEKFFAGGGGGHSWSSTGGTVGAYGASAGGATRSIVTDATPNTGSGGGGGFDNGVGSGAGGSGIVIIRYPTP